MAFIVSFILTMIIAPFLIKLSHEKGLLDYPAPGDLHEKPIPMTGGIGIFVVFFLVCLLSKSTYKLIPLFCASSILLISGLYDDIRGLNAYRKLLMQLIAIIILVSFGIVINAIKIPFGPIIYLGVFSIPVTISWFIVIINIVNILDGLDGLAAGLCAIGLFIVSNFIQMPVFNNQVLILLGSIAAFLIFNFHPAKIFLGNNGSGFLGLAMAYFPLVTSQKSTVTPLLLLSCAVLSVPIIDAIYSILRRTKAGVSIFKGDKKHLHHIALGVIRNYKITVLLFYLLSILSVYIMFKVFFDRIPPIP